MQDESVISVHFEGVDIIICPQRTVEDAKQVFMTVHGSFGNQRQEVRFESLGIWLDVSELVSFEDDLAKENGASLVDIEGHPVFSISRKSGAWVFEFNSRKDEIGGLCSSFGVRAIVPASLSSELSAAFREFDNWW